MLGIALNAFFFVIAIIAILTIAHSLMRAASLFRALAHERAQLHAASSVTAVGFSPRAQLGPWPPLSRQPLERCDSTALTAACDALHDGGRGSNLVSRYAFLRSSSDLVEPLCSDLMPAD